MIKLQNPKRRKILTFTMSLMQSQWEVDRVEEEANKMGIEVNRALYRDIKFSIFNDSAKGGLRSATQFSRVFVKGEEINEKNTLGMWFRVAGTKSGKYVEGRNLAIRLLQNKVFCCNHGGYLKWARMGKIAQHGLFVEHGIPVVPTAIFYTKDQILNPPPTPPLTKGGGLGDRFSEWGWPIIAKHERGYQGKSVRKFENWGEVERFLKKIDEKNLGMFLWQKCLSTRWDLRIIVIGGKAIGAMKRSAVGEEFRSNYSLGGKVEKWELSDKDKKIAEEVARVCELDYAGVDIMKSQKSNVKNQNFNEDDYESYVLEVNRQCQFRGFEMATGINVARIVVEMLMARGRRVL